MFNNLSNIFTCQHHQWPLWYPVAVGCGIAYYFSLNKEPHTILPFLGIALLLFLFTILFRTVSRHGWALLLLLTTLGFVGVTSGILRTQNVQSPRITADTGVTRIQGYIKEIQYNTRGKRYILSDLDIEGIAPAATPQYIRINVNTEDNNAKPGDYIWTLGVLRPPPGPALPEGYNFSLTAYFSKIGAVGYAIYPILVSDCITHSCPEKEWYQYFHPWLSKIRESVLKKIQHHLSEDTSGIAAAMLIGQKGTIPSSLLGQIRDAGIAHLLAISGMHMTLVAGLLFFVIRYLCTFFPRIALRYNTKKIAAIGSMIGCLIYLALANFPISAQRAYIMACLFFITILLDRMVTPLRSVAFAACIVLIFQPESLLTPSFQMSFAAVTAIIAFYEIIRPYHTQIFEKPYTTRIFYHIFFIALTSFIASIATLPFSLFHFHQLSGTGFIANIIAIPVTTFIIMPAGLVSLFLMPFGAEFLSLPIMEWGIYLILHTASYVSQIPKLPAPPLVTSYGIALFSLCALWLIIWQQKLRLLGAIGIGVLLLLWLIFPSPKPDILISHSGNLFALLNDESQYVFSDLRKSRFDRSQWLETYPQPEPIKFPKERMQNPEPFIKEGIYRLYHQKTVSLPPCRQEKLIVLLESQSTQAPINKECLYITYNEIIEQGAHTIYTNKNTVQIVTTNNVLGDRPWNPYQYK